MKIGFVLAKRVGQEEVGRFQHGVPCTLLTVQDSGLLVNVTLRDVLVCEEV